MSIVLYELANSRPFDRSVDDGKVTRKWIATGSQLENEIAAALLVVAPTTWDTLRRTRYGADPLGGGTWMCSVEYSWSANTATEDPEDPADPTDDTELGPESSFDITAATAHVTQSLSTKFRWRPGKTTDTPAGDANGYGIDLSITSLNGFSAGVHSASYAGGGGDVGMYMYISGGGANAGGWKQGAYPITAAAGGGNFTITGLPGRAGLTGGVFVIASEINSGGAANMKQAVGVTRDGVEGTEVYTPKFEFSWSRQVFPVNLPYLRMIRSLVAKTNGSAWRGFQPGEVLYLGATGQSKPGNVWIVNHKFAVGENLYAVPVSPQLIIPRKGAWEYVWAAYGYDADATMIYNTPRAGYVEEMYRSADFTKLGLGR